MRTPVTRRDFIKRNLTAALAAAAFPTIVPASALGRAGEAAPSNRIGVGAIGVGPQGRGVMGNFLRQADARVIAVCDVAKRNLEAALNQVNQHYQNKDCATYGDYRQLLARADIDAVLIATPDHWHVPVAVAAARANKDMYVEKPLGISVEEDQLLRRTIQQQKRIFQFGTQQRSGSQFRQACELVRNGRLGQLKQISAWANASRPGGSTKPVTPPADLNYDFWLGPAPDKPYTDGKAFDEDPPGTWKTWWYNYDYALGFIAGWGIHPLDIALWGHPGMMKGPMEVEGKAVFPTEGFCNTAIAWDATYRFADGVIMKYFGTPNGYDQITPMNDLKPWQQKFGRAVDHGTAFEGSEGWVLVDRGAIRTSPENLVEAKPGPNDARLTQSSNHARNFLDSVRSRAPAICPIEESVQGDILCHLGDIATRLNRALKWDPLKERFLNDAQANKGLAIRSLRAPYRLR